MPLPAPDFGWIFTEGRTFSFPDDDAEGSVSVVPGGELALPTGRVVACDPLVALGVPSAGFTAVVAPGSYPVDVAVVTIGDPAADPPHERVAAARLRISGAPAASWEMALLPGDDPAELDDDQFYGYGVDAGTGCFVDAGVDSAFDGGEGGEDSQLFDLMDAAGWAARPFHHTEPGTGHQIVFFSSGWGDGAYPTWVGRDADGAVCCFVTDFFVIPAEVAPVTAVSGPR